MPTSFGRLVLGAAVLTAAWVAVPAWAAPVFDTASVSPEAISPNGDEVQEIAVISWRIAVPQADVRVLLAQAAGPVVDTLLALTRQSTGDHALAFDGTTRFGAVSDGSYEVRISGVGSQGEGSETRILPLVVDRVAPVISEWTLPAGASSTVKDGDTVSFLGCVNADADTVFIDLSALDSGFDPALVNENPVPPVCRLFTYTISAGNTLPDADGIPAVIEARDRAGNRSTASLDLCLSNDPPTVTAPAVLLNELPFFQNGDEIQVEAAFASPYPLTVTADLSNLDSRFDPGLVQVTPLAGGRYQVRYRIQSGNQRPDGPYPVRVFAYDIGCGVAADSSVSVTLDNAGLNSSLIADFEASPDAFSPTGNGTKQVTIRFTTLVDSLIVTISTIADLQNPVENRVLIIWPSASGPAPPLAQGIHTVTWDGSFPRYGVPRERLADQNLTLILRATSVAQDRQRTVLAPLEVDNVAPVLRAFPTPGQVSIRNGRIANIPVTYDRSGYTLSVDFSQADSNFDPLTSSVVVADSLGGKYGIFYNVSPTNSVPDGTGIPVPITAVDRAGNFATVSDLVTVCLDNLPPHLVSASLLENPGPFRNGDRILIETHWDSEPQQRALQISADFSAVDDRWNAVSRPATVIDRGDGRYDVSYTLSTQNGITSGVDLPVVVTARDAPDEGCGVTAVTAVRVDIDSRAGTAPVFDAAEAVVRDPSFSLSGRAAGSDSVEISRAGTPVDTFYVDPTTERFQGQVTLVPGENVFLARGFDRAGNNSPSSSPLEVFLATRTVFTVPAAFRPGNLFSLVLLEPAQGVTLRIFNLEGVELRRLESGPGELYRIAWDGRDHSGTLSGSGPMIVAAEVAGSGGVRERLRKAFVFTRSGGTP